MNKIEKELIERLQAVNQEKQIVIESLLREYSAYQIGVAKTLKKEAKWLEEAIYMLEKEGE